VRSVLEAWGHGVHGALALRGHADPSAKGRNVRKLRRISSIIRVKQVAPVVVEAENEIVVLTVYTFYF
jgi:hypothetical protein